MLSDLLTALKKKNGSIDVYKIQQEGKSSHNTEGKQC